MKDRTLRGCCCLLCRLRNSECFDSVLAPIASIPSAVLDLRFGFEGLYCTLQHISASVIIGRSCD